MYYDWLDRLCVTQIGGSAPSQFCQPGSSATYANAVAYGATGNVTSKSDVGTYAYPAAGAARPHAVTSTSGGPVVTSFSYDANGNMLSGNGRTITWTAFNMPATITEGSTTIAFQYDGEHNRVRQITPSGTIYYFRGAGRVGEITSSASEQDRRDYITFGGQTIGMNWNKYSVTNNVATLVSQTMRYFVQDHLGSVAVVLDQYAMLSANGEHDSYDAWGKRRYPSGAADPANAITSQTTRGFTAQEELPYAANLIDLNGRDYDPQIGRMLSADPGVQTAHTPYDPQAWNSYAYARNNPLTRTDPAGYDWFSDIGDAFAAAWSDLGTIISNLGSDVAGFFNGGGISGSTASGASDANVAGAISAWQKAGSPSNSTAYTCSGGNCTSDTSALGKAAADAVSNHESLPGYTATTYTGSSLGIGTTNPILSAGGNTANSNLTNPASASDAGVVGSYDNVPAVIVTPHNDATAEEVQSILSSRTYYGFSGWQNDQMAQALGQAIGGTALLGATGGIAATSYLIAAESAPSFSAIGSTGQVGEQWLANNLGGTSQAYFSTSQGARYVDQFANGIANESKVGYTSLTSSVQTQISKDVELMQTQQVGGVNWHFFDSPVTGLGGPSQPLLNSLQQNGINVILH